MFYKYPDSYLVPWSYHVAPIINLNGEHYILDPGVSPRPITRQKWYELVTRGYGARITGFVTCKENAVGVDYHDCHNSDFNEENNEVDRKSLDALIKVNLDR